MRLRRLAIAILVALTAGTGLASCASDAASGDGNELRISYASDNEATALVAAVTRGIEAAAKDAGASISVSDNQQDSAKIVNFARQAATTKPSVFIEYNSVADANERVGRILAEANVPVLAVQYAMEGAPLFAIDNEKVGRIGGNALAEAAKAKWGPDTAVNALLLALPQGGRPQLERRDGARSALSEGLANIDITDADTRQDPNTARQVTADFLSNHPDGKVVVWAHVDSMASAAVAAVRAANRESDALIVGTGGDESIFGEIRRSSAPLIGTVGLFPEDWGKQIIDLATRIARGEDVPAVTTPERIEMITQANINQVYPE